MTCEFEWANYQRLVERTFFERTLQLFILEQQIQTPIPDSMHWTRRFEYPWILEKIVDTQSILDVGAGATALQFLIASQGRLVVSVDVDPGAVAWVQSRAPDQLVKNPRAVLGGLPNLPFGTGEFETTMCISVLEHLPKDQVLYSIQDMIRVSSKMSIITMDIALGDSQQTNQSDLNEICKALGFKPPEIPRYAITFKLDSNEYAVACMQFIR